MISDFISLDVHMNLDKSEKVFSGNKWRINEKFNFHFNTLAVPNLDLYG